MSLESIFSRYSSYCCQILEKLKIENFKSKRGLQTSREVLHKETKTGIISSDDNICSPTQTKNLYFIYYVRNQVVFQFVGVNTKIDMLLLER